MRRRAVLVVEYLPGEPCYPPTAERWETLFQGWRQSDVVDLRVEVQEDVSWPV